MRRQSRYSRTLRPGWPPGGAALGDQTTLRCQMSTGEIDLVLIKTSPGASIVLDVGSIVAFSLPHAAAGTCCANALLLRVFAFIALHR